MNKSVAKKQLIEEILSIKEQYQAEVGSKRKPWPKSIKTRVLELDKLGMQTVKPILDVIDKIFAVEREAKSFENLKLLREEESTQLVEELKSQLTNEYPKSREGSQKRKAILYLQKRWDGFTKFLKDHRIPLSNNEAERTIRHAVMGRKNYYGSGSFTGADTAATLFTVIESCKKNDLDPRTFLTMSLHKAANGENLETPLAYARRTRSHSQSA